MPLKKKSFYFIIGAVMMLALAGCSDDNPQPEQSFSKYKEAWEEYSFSTMYDLLSNETQADINKEDFIERYENIYSGVQVERLSITPEFPEEWNILEVNEQEQVQFPYNVSMETLAGPIEFSLTALMVKEEHEEEPGWYLVWDESMIFPQLKEGDSVRASILPATRGEISDRNGRGLAINGSIVSIGVVPERLEGHEQQSITQLAHLLDISVEQIEEHLHASWVQPHFFVPVAALSEDETEIIDQVLTIEGVTTQSKAGRVYPYKEKTAHLTGYVRPITAEQLEDLEEEGYSAHDLLGQAGLEQVFEQRLRGEQGGWIYTVDEQGNEKETIARKEPLSGENIQLTIDIQVQEALYQQLQDEVGTATAIQPKTGEVLALVNSPAYDPNLFILDHTHQISEWRNDPKQPLLNRFTATYSPGSTFKLITAAIGINSGVLSADLKRDIPRKTWQKDDSWGDYSITRVNDFIHSVNLHDALVYSDNIYFAQSALEIGEEAFIKEATSFGFGEDIPFLYPIRSSQLTANNHFQNEIQLADSGYGQGQILMSPLHMALTYTPLLNDGDLLAPQLDMKQEDRSIWHEDVISPETANMLLQDLVQAVENPRGTAHAAYISGQTIAGKTGTAELKGSQAEESGQENGWFVALHAEDPSILITMTIEQVQNRGGSSYVVSKVKDVLTQFIQ